MYFFQITNKIVNFIPETNLSFNVSRSDSFRELVNALSENELDLPGQNVFQNTLKEEYDKQKQIITSALAKSKKVCTTSDAWSKGGKSFLGVTGHYIDEISLKRRSFLLAFRRITGRSTYDVLGKLIHDIHTEFGLNIQKITHTVTDGGSNYCKAFRVYGTTSETPIQLENDSGQEDSDEEFMDEEDNNEDDDEYIHLDNDVIAYEIDMNRMREDYDEFDHEDNSNEIENDEIK